MPSLTSPFLNWRGARLAMNSTCLPTRLFRLVVLGDTADDSTVFQSVGYLELQQLLHLGYGFAFQYGSYADIQFLEVLE